MLATVALDWALDWDFAVLLPRASMVGMEAEVLPWAIVSIMTFP